jgi:photosystem II stability/assembly factor-like uncharacterized protein
MKSSVIFSAVIIISLSLGGLVFSQEEVTNPLLASWPQYLSLKDSSEFDLDWVQLGPTVNSARLEAFQAHPDQPGTWYAAFGSGNLWKSTNHGLDWRPIFENQPALGIGDIAIAPSNPEIIWLGTGESLKKPRNFTMPGVGVFRSDDAGETWQNTGLSDSYHIGEIAVHPTDPDIVFVAAMGHFWSSNPNRGLYRTIDGGKSWEHVLYINDHVGANDVVISPSNPDLIYVSMWENYPSISGEGSGVYKSTDGGKTFARLQGGFPEGPNVGRIGVAVSWSNPDKVYALVDNLGKEKNEAAEVYQTLDGGETWARTHEEELMIFPGIGWYFTDCYVNPQDDDELYVLGVRMASSKDGGKTFDLVGGEINHMFPSAGHGLHLDHCELWINPQDPKQLALANDGGLYYSYDKGASWMHYNNIPAGEFYDISVDNQTPYNIYGGTQDDSSVFGPAKEWKQHYADGWKYLWIDAWSGGDGCINIPDPVDPDTVYISAQKGATSRLDMKTMKYTRIAPRLPKEHPGELAYEFIGPYIISPHDHKTLYQAGNYVFKSVNRGDEWQVISPDLAVSAVEGKKSNAAGTVAESPLKPGLLYVGTNKGAFWVSKNDGADWSEHSAGLPNHYIRSIFPSKHLESRVYVVVTGINDDVFHNYLFASDDYGNNWQPISANLPDDIAYVILEDPTNENILYAGLYRGVYISVDRGDSWSQLGPKMAPTAIADLLIQEREMDLVVATHGRGIYKMNVRAIHEFFKDGAAKKDILFAPQATTLPWINHNYSYLHAETAEKAPIVFYLLGDADLTISISDGEGKAIWTEDIKGQKGFNQVNWDLVAKREDNEGAYFYRQLQFAKPGSYEVKLTGKDIELATTLVLTENSAQSDDK